MAPGLAGLSARAGEALGSYVAPVAPPSAPAAVRGVERHAAASARCCARRRAAPEFVRTGSARGGRHGGGEVEIPTWFEAAARKMLDERSGTADGISLAELTLVQPAPSTHIAASDAQRAERAPRGAAPEHARRAGQQRDQQIDVEKVANEVYRAHPGPDGRRTST